MNTTIPPTVRARINEICESDLPLSYEEAKDKAWAEHCADLESELAALRADKERLDWLCTADHWFNDPCDGVWTPERFRAAIDTARAGEGGAK